MTAVTSAAVVLLLPLLAQSTSYVCPPANFSSVSDFDLDAFINGRWFIHQQMEVSYLPKSQNKCVYAEYSKKHTFWGYDIHVHNHAEDVAEPHKVHDSDSAGGPPGGLCAKIKDSKTGKLAVAPCFLPPFLAGPYWVIAFDAKEGYSLISGGPPTNPTANGCSTGTGVNDAGLWIFTHSDQRDEALIQKVRGIAKSKGFDLAVLNDVDQTSCAYSNNVELPTATSQAATLV